MKASDSAMRYFGVYIRRLAAGQGGAAAKESLMIEFAPHQAANAAFFKIRARERKRLRALCAAS